MDFGTAVSAGFANYATFAGRARRAEFWWFWLFLVGGSILAGLLDALLSTNGALNAIFSIGTILPQLAVTARRLHDTGRSGWWQAGYLVSALVMGVGAAAGMDLLAMLGGVATIALVVLLIVWLARPGDRGPNRYGEDPLGAPVTAQPAGTGGGNWRS